MMQWQQSARHPPRLYQLQRLDYFHELGSAFLDSFALLISLFQIVLLPLHTLYFTVTL